VIALVRASHFQPAVAVTAIATALALSVGRGPGAVWVALAVAAGQLSVGWSNDFVDRDRDRRADRRDKPIVAGQVRATTVGVAAVLAALVCIPLSLISGWRAGLVHVTAVAVAWLYNVSLKARVVSPVPYLIAFGSLPVFVTLGLDGHPIPPAWAVVSGALLGGGAHFINTLADLHDDVRVGVLGLPQRLGSGASLAIGVLCMVAATFVLALAPSRPHVGALMLLGASLGLVCGVVVAARAGRARAAWSLTLGTAMVAVALFLAHGQSLA
jgi:4-hydroxybenzoate polyprenyltransferase